MPLSRVSSTWVFSIDGTLHTGNWSGDAGESSIGAHTRTERGAEMPTKDDIFPRVKTIIADQGLEADDVTLEASLVEDLGADSLDIVELIMAFEEEFEIEIPDEDAEKIQTVQGAVEYIHQHVK